MGSSPRFLTCFDRQIQRCSLLHGFWSSDWKLSLLRMMARQRKGFCTAVEVLFKPIWGTHIETNLSSSTFRFQQLKQLCCRIDQEFFDRFSQWDSEISNQFWLSPTARSIPKANKSSATSSTRRWRKCQHQHQHQHQQQGHQASPAEGP